ncbi:MAG: hypothetical protein II772_09425, partial [Lachnospiraceae bacterium]|nr:hypothetical protein [Lachnospiraceae bacterium]
MKRDREGQTEHKEKQREECLLRADPFQLIGGANSFREFAPTMSGALCFSYMCSLVFSGSGERFRCALRRSEFLKAEPYYTSGFIPFSARTFDAS